MEQWTIEGWLRLADIGSLIRARGELISAVEMDREVQRLEDIYDKSYSRGEHTAKVLDCISTAEMLRDQALIRCICEIVS